MIMPADSSETILPVWQGLCRLFNTSRIMVLMISFFEQSVKIALNTFSFISVLLAIFAGDTILLFPKRFLRRLSIFENAV